MRTTVIGLGYVGLVTAAGSAIWRNETVGIDTDPRRVDALDSGRVPFHEPGLDDAVREALDNGLFRVTTDLASAIDGAEIVFVAVGTHDGDGGWQTETMSSALEAAVPLLGSDTALVIRSTLPPAYLRKLPGLVRHIRARNGLGAVPLLLNPEFTKEGTALQDFLEPSRVVIGRIDDHDGRGGATLRRFYAGVRAPILDMEGIDASLAKLGSNLFLATKISFANELAALCDLFGASVDDVVPAMGLDPRIGTRFLKPGVGFGGSCLPHQLAMTVRDATSAGQDVPLLAGVEAVNLRQRDVFVRELETAVGGNLAGARVALLGLTFKPDTDDLRDAPSLGIARELVRRGASVIAHDPMPPARVHAARQVPGLIVSDTIAGALEGADVIGLVTEWVDYRELDWSAVHAIAPRASVIDGRNALNPDDVAGAGLGYRGFGRGRLPVPAKVGARADAPAAPVHAAVQRSSSPDVPGRRSRPSPAAVSLEGWTPSRTPSLGVPEARAAAGSRGIGLGE